MGLAEDLTSDCRQHLVGVVVKDVEREVAVDPLQGAGPNQPAAPQACNACSTVSVAHISSK